MAARRTPASTRVLLVRHGRTSSTGMVLPGRSKGLHLSEEGETQAEVAAERLGSIGTIDAVVSSPLERCRETAGHIARPLGARVRVERGLVECDVGDWTGKPLTELAKLPEWKAMHAHTATFGFPGGETFLELQARAVRTVSDLVKAHDGGTIVAVTHADVIKVVLAAALHIPLDAIHRLSIAPCSISAISYQRLVPSVITVNSLSDLHELRPS